MPKGHDSKSSKLPKGGKVPDCRRNHHAVLHSEQEEEVISNTAKSLNEGVGLGVIKVFTKTSFGKKESINDVIDEGSDTTLIRDNLILSLDCEARKIP